MMETFMERRKREREGERERGEKKAAGRRE
jgi:hypothetical protein